MAFLKVLVNDLIRLIAEAIIVASALFGLFKWFGEKIIDRYLNRAFLKRDTEIVEKIKAELSKENITHQIFTTEYARMRFQRLDELTKHLIDVKAKTEAFILIPIMQKNEDYKSLASPFLEAHHHATNALSMATMYIDENIVTKTNDFLSACMKALGLSTEAYTKLFAQREFAKQGQQEERINSSKDYNKTNNELRAELMKLPGLLNELQQEYKKHLIGFSSK